MASNLFVSILDFKSSDGRVRWEDYDRACKEIGQKCKCCGVFLLTGLGKPQRCAACQALDDDREEVRHHASVRCPHCKHVISVTSSELNELYSDGEHDVCCPACERDFTVSTSVSFTFKSPALNAEVQ